VREGLKLLRILSSSTSFPPLQKVQELIQAIQQPDAKITEDMEKFIKELDDGITLGEDKIKIDDVEAANFWDLKMLEEIDKAAVTHFQDSVGQMGTPEDGYLNALTKYVADVTLVFRQHLAGDVELAERAITRFTWAMLPRTGRRTPMPIMTNSIVFATAVSASVVEVGLAEVSLSP
jgi:hypothetical protein